MSNVIKKEKYICVEGNDNHNKFWAIELCSGGTIITTWGRVGQSTVNNQKNFGDDNTAQKEYNKLIKSKIKKGYSLWPEQDIIQTDTNNSTIIKQDLKTIALDQIDYDKNDKSIVNMIQSFCDANIHNITENTTITFNGQLNVFQTPLGIVTVDGVTKARTILNQIYNLVNDDNYNNDYNNLTEQYLRIIPMKAGRKLIFKNIFPNIKSVTTQNGVLDSLEDSIKFIEQINKDQNNFEIKTPKTFNACITLVDDKKTINQIKDIYNQTAKSIHSCYGMKIKNVYQVNIDHMEQQYNDTKQKWTDENKKLNHLMLWHGTRKHNIISILKNGLIIPSANASHCCGRMYGDCGVYFSDQSTKSLNYSYGFWSNGKRDDNCFMFLVDVLAGQQYIPTKYGNYDKLIDNKTYDSVFAKANYSGVQNNEMIVPIKQTNIKYLVEFEK